MKYRSWEQMVRLLSNARTHRCHRRPEEELMALIYLRAKIHSPAEAGMLAHRGSVGPHPTYSQQQQHS